jgi:hypothetical protein
MASIILRSKALQRCPNLKWSLASISTTSSRCTDDISKSRGQKEAPQISDLALLNPEEVEQRKRLQGYITVDATVSLRSFDATNPTCIFRLIFRQ